MSRIFDVNGMPGTPTCLVELDKHGLSELIGRDFIINRARTADEVFQHCDLLRILLVPVNGQLQLHMRVTRNGSPDYTVPMSAITHLATHLWLAGTDKSDRQIALFRTIDGTLPNGNPCTRIRILVFPQGDSRARPPNYQYTQYTAEPGAPPPEPPCQSGSGTREEDEESEGYFER